MSFRVSLPSIKSLYVEMHVNNQKLGSGTAFVAISSNEKCFLVTARHNVTGRNNDTDVPIDKYCGIPDTLIVWHNSVGSLGAFVQVKVPLLIGDAAQWIEHPTRKGSVDFVVIPVEGSDRIQLYPYRLDYNSHLGFRPTQPVSVIGFPFGERTAESLAIWSTGFVASEPELDHGGRPVFLIDCRSRKGQSGSPVVIHYGDPQSTESGTDEESAAELLGIYSGRINEDSDLGIVWKSYAIAELVDYASLLQKRLIGRGR